MSFLHICFLIYCFSSEEIEIELEYSGRISEGAPSVVVSKLHIYINTDYFSLKDNIMVKFTDDKGDEIF